MDNNSVLKQIGNTPLIKLKQASEITQCNIYAKAEYFNPGESVKDRAALFIVEDALKNKKIQKGGTIVEGTAGNTGIGLAVVAKAYGLNLKIVIPKTQSIEKKQTLKDLGAELIEVDAVPYSNPKNYVKQSEQIAKDLAKTNSNGVYWANQFDNTINTEAHIKTTAQEIWSQTAGKIHGFVCAVGTGGTLAGVSIGLKNKKKYIKIALSDEGLGISSEDQKLVFSRFYRTAKARADSKEGSGLGLAITKHLVNQLHGEVGVMQNKVKGSTFWFTLPKKKK